MLDESNSSFSIEIPNLQIAWDSTSLGNLKTCPRYYQYTIIDGWQLRGGDGTEPNPHILFGQIFHSATETYDKSRACAYDHNESLITAIRHAIFAAFNRETNRLWQSSEPTKTLKTLLRTITWYLDKFENDPLETVILDNGSPAVELSFSFTIDKNDPAFCAPNDESYILCGHLDKVARYESELYIGDKKTTKIQLSDSYFANYSPDNQFSLYTIAGKVVLHKNIEGVIVDATQVLVNGSRFQRRIIQRTEAQLEEWLQDLKIYLRMAEAYAKINYWPQNDKACSMYGGCRFRPVCSADPSAREDLLNAFYTKRIWDPLQPR